LPRHPDFEKIYKAFMKRYCRSAEKECEKGKQVYYAWLNKMGLDDTKPYRKPQEKFRWAKPAFDVIRQDKEAKYYKVEALFPTVSMNRNVYTRDELVKAARTLIGKPVNLNHQHSLAGVTIVDADYEDEAVECLLRVERTAQWNGQPLTSLIDNGEIIHVSIEGTCRTNIQDAEGVKCQGLVLTGLALLTKDVLPGLPLTRIIPVEKLVENFTLKEGGEKLSEQETEKVEKETSQAKDDSNNTVTEKADPEKEKAEEPLLKKINQLETTIKLLQEQVEKQQTKIQQLIQKKEELEAKLKKAKRFSRIIVRI
jgi:hypothetical protein